MIESESCMIVCTTGRAARADGLRECVRDRVSELVKGKKAGSRVGKEINRKLRRWISASEEVGCYESLQLEDRELAAMSASRMSEWNEVRGLSVTTDRVDVLTAVNIGVCKNGCSRLTSKSNKKSGGP